MTAKFIGNDKTEFADKYFPRLQSEDSLFSRATSVSLKSSYAELEHADELDEKTLQDNFIRMFNQDELSPGLKLATCKSRPGGTVVDQESQNVTNSNFAIWRDGATTSRNWADVLLPVVFKASKSDKGNCQDPYCDAPNVPGGVVVSDSPLHKTTSDHIISLPELIFSVQQRIAVFMLVVVGRTCRFLRWDHSGAVVTQSIDYYKDWEFFCEILWRIAHCSDDQLGVDPSAVRLTEEHEEFKAMDEAAIASPDDVDEEERTLDVVPQAPFTFKYVREMFVNSLNAQWPRYKLEVPDGDTTRHFLVCKPVFLSSSLIDRGTRGYVALDCDTGRFVWLKDVWRASYLLLEKEGDVLAKLKKAEVPYIPTLVCHGDIRDQTTLTSQEWERQNPDPKATRGTSQTFDKPGVGVASSSSSKRKRTDDESDDAPPPKGLNDPDLPFREDSPLRIHKHYRLVEEEVAMPLDVFQTGRQLVFIIYQCIFAHFKAATNELHPTLHRDISGGNILICPRILATKAGTHRVQWEGLLADWEMSKPHGNDVHRQVGQRQPERTGTWQFMSVALLSGNKAVEICDELEAFFYVLLYYAARYLQSNLDGFTLVNYLDEFFDQYKQSGDGWSCGHVKRRAIETGRLVVTRRMELRFGGSMDHTIATLLSWFHSHHVVSTYEQKRQEAEPLMASPVSDAVRKAEEFDDAITLADGLVEQVTPAMLGPTTWGLPSSKDQLVWENVKKHAFVMKLLEFELLESWPRNDKVGDRIPKPWVRPVLDSAATKTTSSNKRARADHKAGMVTAFPIPPSQRAPPQSPRHAATSPDAFWIHQAGTKDPESLPP